MIDFFRTMYHSFYIFFNGIWVINFYLARLLPSAVLKLPVIICIKSIKTHTIVMKVPIMDIDNIN